MRELVLEVNSRCRHGNPLPMGETECDFCKWENYVLGLKPPFKVKCLDDKDTNLTKGSVYTVIAVIEKGKLLDEKTVFPCFLLKNEDGSASPRGYTFMRFETV